jgi:hypothetical protein
MASEPGSDALRYAYEDLRAHALTGDRGPGLALFLRHGLRKWIEVYSSCTPVMAALQHTPAAVIPEYVPPETRSEIVSILAGLFLQKRWEATQ